MKTLLVAIPVVYVVICILLYFIQDRFIFHPTTLPPSYNFSEFDNISEKFYEMDEGQLHALHFQVSAPKGMIIYFHGNSGALDDWGHAAKDFTDLGYEVIMPDYRSYGKSEGSLSEENIHKDAQLIYEEVLKDWAAKDIILYGRSLGTGVATELATKVSAKMLILETPYTSITAMASKTLPFLPTKWLLKFHFNNLEKIESIKCPVHIFAATNDQLTPHSHAVQLAKKTAKPAETLTSIQGAEHGNINTFASYHQKLKMLLSE